MPDPDFHSAKADSPDDDSLRRPPGAPAADAPDGSSLDAHLLELRARLRQAREERGGCPPWNELRADLVPGGGQREGREQRQAHVAICPYCSTHVGEWRNSDDFAADRLEAIERGVARGLTGGAMGLLRTIGRALPARTSEPRPPRERKARTEKRALSAREERELAEAAAEAAAASASAAAVPAPTRKAAPPPATEPAPARETSPPTAPAPPVQRMYEAPAPRPADCVEAPTSGRLLVVEMADGRTPPEAVFLCARVFDAEVAQVDSIDELVGDPDLPMVLGVVLGGLRPPASWPDDVRHARLIVKGRPVLLMASFGAEPTAGARRALGDALLSESDPPERLLLALDPGLR